MILWSWKKKLMLCQVKMQLFCGTLKFLRNFHCHRWQWIDYSTTFYHGCIFLSIVFGISFPRSLGSILINPHASPSGRPPSKPASWNTSFRASSIAPIPTPSFMTTSLIITISFKETPPSISSTLLPRKSPETCSCTWKKGWKAWNRSFLERDSIPIELEFFTIRF